MRLYVKFMLSLRCQLAMKHELKTLGVGCLSIDSGVVEIAGDLGVAQRELLRRSLLRSGMELLSEAQSHLMERLEEAIFEMVSFKGEAMTTDEPAYLSHKLEQDFPSLSHLFSEAKGVSIEQYIMVQKIERAKEYFLYEDLRVSEVAEKLRFRNGSHLSRQFKKTTGLTPLFFKQLRRVRRQIQGQYLSQEKA